jgi:hypothetical protein
MTMAEILKSAREAATKLATGLKSDIYFLSGGVERGVDKAILEQVAGRLTKHLNAVLILTTEGGDADAAFRISRCFQDAYEKFTVVVAGWCKSAGTLVCIGANELVMGLHAELGPLDVQLAKPDDLSGRISGLTIASAFASLELAAFNLFQRLMLKTIEDSGGAITTKTASAVAATITSGLLAPVYQQIDPNKVGDDYRSMQVAEEYARRLILKGRNLQIRSDWNAVDALVRGYPSHGFVIDLEEAKRLFRKVDRPTAELTELLSILGDSAVIPRSYSRGENPLALYLNDEVPHAAEDTAKPPVVGNGAEERPSEPRPSRRRRDPGTAVAG